MLSKKSKSEDRINDLALSCDRGEISALSNKLKRTKTNDSFIKKLRNSIFFIPKFQNITSSFLFSYFSKMYEKDKNTTKGKILLIILGKLSKVYLK